MCWCFARINIKRQEFCLSLQILMLLYSWLAYFWSLGCFRVCWCVTPVEWCFIRKRVWESVFSSNGALWSLTLQRKPNGEACSSVAKTKSKVRLLPPTGEWERKQTFPLSSSVSVATPPPHRHGDTIQKAEKSFDTWNGKPSAPLSSFLSFAAKNKGPWLDYTDVEVLGGDNQRDDAVVLLESFLVLNKRFMMGIIRSFGFCSSKKKKKKNEIKPFLIFL